MRSYLQRLQRDIEGEVLWDETTIIAYATDASAYREKPLAVIRPKSKEDIRKAVLFARDHETSIIPRAAGTSLAGQVVGGGIVVDISKYMTQVLELNVEERWVRVEPGVVRDELNLFLKEFGLFFGPETSTSNRCMIGGMLGNNACGAQSVLYGSTRDHTLEVKAFLSDGSEAHFKSVTSSEFEAKCEQDNLEGQLYRDAKKMLSKVSNQEEIRKEFPKADIKRRNTGYAIDLLLETAPFTEGKENFNFCKLLAGSEGTLAFTTEIKLNLVPVAPPVEGVLAVHFETLDDALRANMIALKYKPSAVELMDDIIIDCTKGHKEHEANRFFIKGNPKAVLMIQFERETQEEIAQITKSLIAVMKTSGYGYHFPLIFAPDTKKVWNLRKAGLGLLSNVKGKRRSTTVIEDTAVSVADLPEYVQDFQYKLDENGLSCVFYAHVGSGELHLRPMLDLKNEDDLRLFYKIGKQIAHLVKKYNGSLSGEHGDGRLRGEFIPLMLGEHNYKLLQDVKHTWDPENVFNPGKIVDAPSMREDLRLDHTLPVKDTKTVFDFDESSGGILGAAERCNGSGDCRKSEIIGGTMCPSFKATRDEKHTTRARANLLREFLTRSPKANPFNHKELYEVFDLCLACKACKSECPSSVDVAKLKMEFLQHYYDANGAPLRSKLIANITRTNQLAAKAPRIFNLFMQNAVFGRLAMMMIGFSGRRRMPALSKTTLRKWYDKAQPQSEKKKKLGKVFLFSDEFTNYNDSDMGIKAIRVLTELGYEVVIPQHVESGRTYLSKGFVRKAQQLAIRNVEYLADLVSEKTPLIGLEPSALLSFRDEYPDLIGEKFKGQAVYEKTRHLAANSFLIEEFLANEIDAGRINKNLFRKDKLKVKLHGHCQQKAIASTSPTMKMLTFLPGINASEIPSGCCGMAGSFGYEAEHYDISMKIGEQVLFPAVREADEQTIIVAAGTSCRHQIKDGTGRKAVHPIEVWFDALK